MAIKECFLLTDANATMLKHWAQAVSKSDLKDIVQFGRYPIRLPDTVGRPGYYEARHGDLIVYDGVGFRVFEKKYINLPVRKVG